MITFRRKDFSNAILDDALTGAGIGAATGVIVGGKAGNSLPKFVPGSSWYNKQTSTYTDDNGKTKVSNKSSLVQQGAILAATTLVGTALGAICGTIKEVKKLFNGPKERLLGKLAEELKKEGYVEGKDFTRDPKTSDRMKTKVCLVLSTNGAEFKALINHINDRNLKSATDLILKDTLSKINHQKSVSASNKYNEISISTIPNAKNNLNTALQLVKGFIDAGYPVFLVEVG